MSDDVEKKGFSGLSGLLSDVELEKITPQKENISAIESEEDPVVQSGIIGDKVKAGKSETPTPKGVWVILGIVFLIWILNSNDNTTSKTGTATNANYSSYSASLVDTPKEEIPPVGNGLVLSRNQIFYCKSEKIRMDTIEGAVNRYDDGEVSKFNALISDYNDRCGSFRYSAGTLEGAQAFAEKNRLSLTTQGMDRLQNWRNQSQAPPQALSIPAQTPEQIFNLAMSYVNVKSGQSPDYGTAARLLRQAADQGYAPAQLSLGALYMQGNGVLEDKIEALKWFQKSADGGDADAQTVLGLTYKNGDLGLLADDTKAAEWFRKAADQGNSTAEYNLGLLYGLGKGVPADGKQAIELIAKAADAGNEQAKTLLEKMKQSVLDAKKNTAQNGVGNVEASPHPLLVQITKDLNRQLPMKVGDFMLESARIEGRNNLVYLYRVKNADSNFDPSSSAADMTQYWCHSAEASELRGIGTTVVYRYLNEENAPLQEVKIKTEDCH